MEIKCIRKMQIILFLFLIIIKFLRLLSANPTFLNLNGNLGFGAGYCDLYKELYYAPHKRYYPIEAVYKFNPLTSISLYFNFEYGLTDYLSIYAGATYISLFHDFYFTWIYDENGNLVVWDSQNYGEYYVSIDGISIEINTKIRSFHHDQNLNHWIAFGPGTFFYKPKLFYRKDYRTLTSKSEISENDNSVLWYLNAELGMDIKLSKKCFLYYNGFFRYYLQSLIFNFQNIDYINGTDGNDAIKCVLNNIYEFGGKIGIGYKLYKGTKYIEREVFKRNNKVGVSYALAGFSNGVGVLVDYFFTKYISSEIGIGIYYLKPFKSELYTSGKIYLFNANWTPYGGIGFLYSDGEQEVYNRSHYIFCLPVGIEYMNNSGAVFAFEVIVKCGIDKNFVDALPGYKIGIRF